MGYPFKGVANYDAPFAKFDSSVDFSYILIPQLVGERCDFKSSKLDGMNMKSIHSCSLPGLIGHTTAYLHDHSDMI